MKKVKCTNGHYFDADRFQTCPICDRPPEVEFEPPSWIQEKSVPSTVPLASSTEHLPSENNIVEDGGNEGFPQPHDPGIKDNEWIKDGSDSHIIQETSGRDKLFPSKNYNGDRLIDAVNSTNSTTVHPLPKTVAYYGTGTIEPPVAWLVCVKGVYVGKAFECRTGRNKIGRGIDMDINLESDLKVTREVNAFITYEPKKRVHYVQVGNGNGLVYHNGDIVMTYEPLEAYDHILVGESEFVYVPLCNDSFAWEDYIKEGTSL